MNIANVQRGERGFTITWDDRSSGEYPYVWLRDNDPEDLHPTTRERVFDLTSIELPINPDAYRLEDGTLRVDWPGKPTPSAYSATWLRRHRPGSRRTDPAVVRRTAWEGDSLRNIPRLSARDCARSPDVLLSALRILKETGLLLLDELPDTADASQSFGELIGFRRRTNFGDMFEVISLPEPHNLAYTALALPLHTDLPNQEAVPGYQLLHCYKNSVSGGESIFADGLRICADLEAEAPEDFALLQRTPVPWRFHDADNDIRSRRPVINLRADGCMDYFVFNAHIADIPDMRADELHRFYPAYRRLMQRIREPSYSVQYRLEPGELVMFDNTRVLHSRRAFDPRSGERHLLGFYLERNEIDSRIRVLARENR